MLKATLVSYLNTKPFLQGLERFFSEDELSIQLVPPALCAASLKNRDCDIALVPVGALADLPGVTLMKDHCIGACGKVNSVFLLANEPIENLHTLVPDSDSRTSNLLASVLAKGYWYKKFKWSPEMPQETAGVGRILIGDKAMQMKAQFSHVFDLAGEWEDWTGLPFVFAVWAYYPEQVSPESLEKFREALQDGIERIPEAARFYGPEFGLSEQEALQYLSKNLKYHFDDRMHQGFARFKSEMRKSAEND